VKALGEGELRDLRELYGRGELVQGEGDQGRAGRSGLRSIRGRLRGSAFLPILGPIEALEEQVSVEGPGRPQVREGRDSLIQSHDEWLGDRGSIRGAGGSGLMQMGLSGAGPGEVLPLRVPIPLQALEDGDVLWSS